MYIEYWGLKKHPFDNVPDPAMYFNMHQSVDEAVSEILFAIEEGDECLAVAIGPVGVGKTMCLRIVLDSLSHDKYRIAFVTNPDMTFPQLVREIVGQLEGKMCEESRRDKLLEHFNRILFETSDQHKRVVIFIDEGNVLRPHNLESLRLLTNMQDDHQNLLTIVLAGQPELGKRLEHPHRANLFQRIGVYCKIEGIDSKDTMRDYMDHRLERAGMPKGKRIFTDDAVAMLWETSDGGIPRVINKLCKLSLKAGETNRLTAIDSGVVRAIADRFMRSYHTKKRKIAEQPPPEEDLLLGKEAPAASPPTEPESPPAAAPSQDVPAAEPVREPLPAAPVPEPAAAGAAVPSAKGLSRQELETLASSLATERVKFLKQVSDPFEAWEKARDEILAQMLKNQEG